jgi:7-cyano-7-deazaguanine synthase in queuosine biosynthesis
MPTVLLMLSGGVDSTFMLYHYLTQTTDTVHAHHISIRYPHLPRWKMEDPAVQRIVAHCREKYRHFDYSESSFSLNVNRDAGWDSDLQLLVASKIVPNIQADHVTVALGWCMDDMARPEVATRAARHVTPNLWRALWESIDNNKHVNPKLDMPLIKAKLRKVDMLRQMPPELLRLCWSCRGYLETIRDGVPCGQCTSCKFNQQAFTEAGLNPSEFPNLINPNPEASRNARPVVALDGYQNAKLIDTPLPFEAIRREIEQNHKLWEIETNDRRIRYPMQREAEAILLRWTEGVPADVWENDVHPSFEKPAAKHFPLLLEWLYRFAEERGGELGRVSIARLPPGKRVHPHRDGGNYYKYRDRYHIVVNSPSGSLMTCGGETMRWREGELWWFDNKLEHAAVNDSSDNRDHIIFDLLPDKNREFVKEPT